MSKQFSSLTEWLDWQESLHPTAIDLGLSRIAKVYTELGLPQKPAPVVITVAGTNGKGSSLALLQSIFMAAGYRTGAYTSPHILQYNERIRINGSCAGDEDIIAAFAAIDQIRAGTSLTYFEFGTLAALYLFCRQPLDVVILEVGLGGRLDATNIIDADLALITSIGLDHTQWLGDTRELIAREKAGVFRAGQLAVCADAEPPASLLQYALELGTRLYCYGQDFVYQKGSAGWDWHSKRRGLESLPWPGNQSSEIQLQNSAAVLMAVSLLEPCLPCMPEEITSGIQNAQLNARFEQISLAPEVWLDVAHNADAFGVLAQNLAALPAKKIYLVLGVMKDKAVEQMLVHLLPHVEQWHIAKPAVPRGMPVEQLQNLLQAQNAQNIFAYGTICEAFLGARASAGDTGRILVTGSFITVSEVMAEFYVNSL